MRENPVYKKETRVSARSFRMVLILLIFNGILAMVTLLNMYSNLQRAKLTAEIQYSSFLDLYSFVSILEFVMVIFIMPALTAGSISGEYERRTLDILLTTKLTPWEIVWGKLEAALSTMALMLISSLPVMSLMFVYGGASMMDIGLLFVSYMTAALLMGGLGICCSAIFQKSTLATVAAYAVMGIMVAGTFGVNWFSEYLSRLQMEASAAVVPPGSEPCRYLLLLNPASTFVGVVLRLSGRNYGWTGGSLSFADGGMVISKISWIGGSILLQLAMAAMLIAAAVQVLTPEKRSRKRERRKE
ncbi:MAG: ABC transporter permease [Clostridiales bacterium]|nr:ABC transporter permease [Clostridiales bacterium]